MKENDNELDVVGLAPMAGRGTRLGLAGSKELAPLSTDCTDSAVLSEIMFRRMLEAGIRAVAVTVAPSKTDIRTHYGDRYVPTVGSTAGLTLNYITIENSPNTPASINAAYEFVQGKICALGFADILYFECPGYNRALAMLKRGNADVVLGLFPTSQAQTSDMVAFDADGLVQDIHIKKTFGGRFAYTWSLAVWRPSFTGFLRHWMASRQFDKAQPQDEQYVGDVVLAAMRAGMRVEAIPVSAAPSLDAGTPQALSRAQRQNFI